MSSHNKAFNHLSDGALPEPEGRFPGIHKLPDAFVHRVRADQYRWQDQSPPYGTVTDWQPIDTAPERRERG
jgi:hypothetical protein